MTRRKLKKLKFARFAVRDGSSGLLLGKSFNGLLKPGRVYQVVDILGELVIKDMGELQVSRRQKKVRDLVRRNRAA